jgi:hypothetical protein
MSILFYFFQLKEAKAYFFQLKKAKAYFFYLNSLGPKGAEGFHSWALVAFLLAENYSHATPCRAKCCKIKAFLRRK